MVNKNGEDTDFESSDFDILSDCARKVADELHIRFRELLGAANLLSGRSSYINDRTGSISSHRIDRPTKASIAGQYLNNRDADDPSKAFRDEFSPYRNDPKKHVLEAKERQNRRKSFGEDINSTDDT